MDYTRDRTVMVFCKRVFRFAGRSEVFTRGRQNRSPKGLKWVVPVQKACIVGRDRHAEALEASEDFKVNNNADAWILKVPK